jgi:hypothetical protein
MPTIEVRFQNLEAEAQVRVGSSGLPTLLNSVVNTVEVRHRTTRSRAPSILHVRSFMQR